MKYVQKLLFTTTAVITRSEKCLGADRYILFCGPMFVPEFVLSQPTFWDRPLFRRNLQKNNTDIPMFGLFS